VSASGDSWLPFGSITDVDGITVGHFQRTGRGWQTGTTVVIAEGGATPGVDVRGGGPGTRETDAIDPQNLVQKIHGICLTGGSAFGLAASHGLMEWLETRGLGFSVGTTPGPTGTPQVVPVVPAAVIFDLGRGGDPSHRPDAEFGHKAARNARRNQARWGAVGAGTGARAGGLQGGVGTASAVVRIPGPDDDADIEVTVGALVVANPNGTVIDPTSGLPWEPSGLRMKRPPATERRALNAELTGGAIPGLSNLNTTIGVVATTARLDKAETSKLASVAHDGMARAVRPAHSMTDGDTIFGLATGAHALPDITRHQALNLLLAAAADTFAAACTHAVLAATTLGTAFAYSEVCPSAVR
jgi:L-aminopeptidase/D-esterase-like protein